MALRQHPGPVLAHMAAMADPDCKPGPVYVLAYKKISPIKMKRRRMKFGVHHAYERRRKPRPKR